MYLRIKQTFLWGRKIFDDSEFKAKLKNGLKSFDLNEDDFYSIMVVPLMAFFETSKDSLSASLQYLLKSPSLIDFTLHSESKEIKTLTEELIRFISPLQFTVRINTKKISIEGQKFPHQTKFLLALASAKRDSDIFETGDQIIPNRVKNNHLSFGLGSHVCLGSMIARKEMEIGLKPMIHFLKYYKIHAVKPLIWDNQIFMRTLKEAIVTRNKIWFK